MPRQALEVAEIFRDHGPAWRHEQAGHLSLEQLKVMSPTWATKASGSAFICAITRSSARTSRAE